jgi:polysaccharide export outer membrane protein
MKVMGYKTALMRGGPVLIGLAALAGTAVFAAGAGPKQDSPVVIPGQPGSGASISGENRPGLQQRNPRYQLSKGDIFELTFPITPEFNQTVTVQPDGFVTLTGVGDIPVAGKTVPEVRELLLANYSKILHDPVINLVLKDFQKPYFIFGGEISHPGKFEMRDDTTAAEAVAMAGGFTQDSKHSEVLLFRRVSTDWVEVKRLDVKKMFATENLSEDMHLQPGDMLYVPKNRMSKFRRYIPYPSLGAFIPVP